MHVNSKMILVETVPGMEGEGKKRTMEEINSNMIYLI
jgi:hypothetical protein